MESITIHDILHHVPVTDRTIRNWVAQGLIARPIRISHGYQQGVIGYYEADTILRAKLLNANRYLSLDAKHDMINKMIDQLEDTNG